MTYCRSDIQRWQASTTEMVSTCNDTEINQKMEGATAYTKWSILCGHGQMSS